MGDGDYNKKYKESLSKLVFIAVILITLSNFLLNINNLNNFATICGIVISSMATLYLNLAIIKSGYEEKPNLEDL